MGEALEPMSRLCFRFLRRVPACVLGVLAVVSPVLDGTVNRWTELSCDVTTSEGPPGVALHAPAAFSRSS